VGRLKSLPLEKGRESSEKEKREGGEERYRESKEKKNIN
jgi:hypothetical protein